MTAPSLSERDGEAERKLERTLSRGVFPNDASRMDVELPDLDFAHSLPSTTPKNWSAVLARGRKELKAQTL
jgi:hypothetical protein